MNKIDINNGFIYVNGMVIEPYTNIELFKKEKAFHINDRGNGRAIITLIDWVESNGIRAKIKIQINGLNNSYRINIFPESVTGNTLEASKKWLSGMLGCVINNEKEDISLSFQWGYITAQNILDPHYGIVGGDIFISYKKYNSDLN